MWVAMGGQQPERLKRRLRSLGGFLTAAAESCNSKRTETTAGSACAPQRASRSADGPAAKVAEAAWCPAAEPSAPSATVADGGRRVG